MEKHTDNPSIESKITWALLTWALWDALGVPTEMRSPKYIKERYGRVDTFMPTSDNLFFSKHEIANDVSGYYSDDTVLTFAIVKSINEMGGIDMKNLWEHHIQWYEWHPYGFGAATKMAFEKIKEGIPLEEIINPNGWGNGMMMKQFPLAAYFALHDIDPKQEEQTILDISKVSHGHPAALVAAMVHHQLLKKLLKTQEMSLDKKQLLQELIEIAQTQESAFENLDTPKISEVLIKIQSHMDDNGSLSLTDEEIYNEFGWTGPVKNSWFITTTLWIVYALFLRDTTIDSVWDAVNFGWDTDTYASIIGNMSGSLHGEQYDDKLIGQIQDIDTLKKQVNDFIYKLLW